MIQMIKTFQCKDYRENNGRKDVLIKVLKDEEKDEKYIEILDDPDFEFYMNKEEYLLDHHVNHIPLKKVDKVICKSADIYKTVAYKTGNENYFWDCIKNKQFKLLKKLHLDPNIHGSDINLEDLYIGKHYDENPIDKCKNKLDKAFFDIETDTIDIIGFPDPEKAECPVNSISAFFTKSMTLYGFALKNEKYDNFNEFTKKENLAKYKKKIIQKYKDIGYDIKFKLVYYDEEIKLLKDFFFIINEVESPDIIGGWNSFDFDINYIYNRILKLGYDPMDIMCSKSIPYKLFNLNVDSMHQDPADKNSRLDISSTTIYVDMMLVFAKLRKSFGKRDSYELDKIMEEELNEHKIDYIDQGITIKNMPYKNYELFLNYSLHDTFLLFLLENKNMDFDMLYMLSAISRTRINVVTKKTISLANAKRKFLYDQGYVMSNNHNYNKTKIMSRGAFVAKSQLNKNVGIKINGVNSSYIFEFVIDFDATSMYPMITVAFNIDETTQIGKIVFKEDENNNEENLIEPPEFTNDIVSKDYLNIGSKYFNLPDLEELVSQVESKLIS